MTQRSLFSSVTGRMVAAISGLTLLALLVATSVILPVAPFAGQPTLDHQVRAIGEQLRCVVCEGQSVAESASSVAIEQRQQIREMLQQGMSEEEILADFRQRYGDWILLSPPARGPVLLAWVLPFAMLAAGLYLLSQFLRRSQGDFAAEFGAFGKPGQFGEPGEFGEPVALGEPAAFGKPGELGKPGEFGAPADSGELSGPREPADSLEGRDSLGLPPGEAPEPEDLRDYL